MVDLTDNLKEILLCDKFTQRGFTMIKFETEHLLAQTEMKIVDGKLVPKINSNIDILNITITSGRESGFIFFDKNHPDALICHIDVITKRGKFELSYGTEKKYQCQGYMTEALSALTKWIFTNTNESEIWALITDNSISAKVLSKCGFVMNSIFERSAWFVLKR